VNLSPQAREIVNTIRRHRLDYRQLIRASAEARRHLGLKPPKGGRRLPHLLTEPEIKAFYTAIDTAGNISHQVMLRLLFFTSIRVSELVHIKVSDVDLQACKIFIESGKGDKDRYILFPEFFRLILQAHLNMNPDAEYLFESRLKKPVTTRWVQILVKDCAAQAGIGHRVHPHLFRHQMLSFLTKEGVPDAAIQLISGHATKQSLERYQHVTLDDVKERYQAAVRKLEI
jgi:integrase/recombinase XerD